MLRFRSARYSQALKRAMLARMIAEVVLDQPSAGEAATVQRQVPDIALDGDKEKGDLYLVPAYKVAENRIDVHTQVDCHVHR